MTLIQYNQLTEFQKWLFFYLIKNTFAPVTLDGVLPKMCLTVKMKIDVDKYESETQRLVKEANQLVENGLLRVSSGHHPSGEFVLTDKGELYVLQKILGPLIKIKDKNAMQQIKQYTLKEDSDTQTRITHILYDMNPQKQNESLVSIANRVLDHAMPYLNAIDKIHQFARFIGIA